MAIKIKEKTCRHCKKKFMPKFSTLQVCCSPKCALEYSKKKDQEKDKKEWKAKIKEMDVRSNAPKHKTVLQNEINKLARLIDERFGYKCIDCDINVGDQSHGAHFHNVGSHNNVRYNLHNIHKANAQCNQFSSEHKVGYREGIVARYGQDYLEEMEEMLLKYDTVRFSNQEVYDLIPIVRKLIRDLHKFDFSNGRQARNQLNKIIGIYL